ncbi:MAG: TetR/AcrR family transcriptional regulator [Dehalococcoidia bacterium]
MSPRVGLNREAILDAAERLADRDGYEALTLHAIAAAVGVRAPSLYHHVRGFDAIRRGLHLRGLAARADAFEVASRERDRRSLVAACAYAQRRAAQERPGVYAASQPSSHTPDTDDELHAAGERALGYLVTAMGELGLVGDDALHAVRVFRAAVHGFIELESLGAFGMGIDPDESFARLVEVLERGLTAAQSHAESGDAARVER